MLKVELAKPIYLNRQLDVIAKESGIAPKMLSDVAECISYVTTDKDSSVPEGSVVSYQTIREENIEGCLTGADAVTYLCKLKGIEAKPLNEVNIPVEVYDESCQELWHQICYLFRRIIFKNKSLENVLELDAPNIILSNAERMLKECIEQLEDNSSCSNPVPYGKDNKEPLMSLANIGYSLANGWSEEMLERFRKEDEEFDKMFEGLLNAEPEPLTEEEKRELEAA